MSSLIEGYKYDIFISYRQKDNKGDHWVSEFVKALMTELESTFKEEISVYFDINPHDGLLETHDVEASLREKLKCVVFIPIISRTYCDPKSFAWEHEFKAFVEMASKDQFGLKVKLPNGNVACRILPVRIYDLDASDIKLCESVLGGVLRGVDFIYSEPGVNRPLKSDDDEKANLNKTRYRNQINKLGNAIKEIISGLKTEPIEDKEQIQYRELPSEVRIEEKERLQEQPVKTARRRMMVGSIVLSVILIIASIFVYPKIFKRDSLEKLTLSGNRISVAVMPFLNMTNDTIWNIWQDGIKDELISSLSNYPKELKIRQSGSINTLVKSKELKNYELLTISIADNIAQKLDVDIFIYGRIMKAGDAIRITAQLFNTETGDVFRSIQIEGLNKEEYIFHMIDSLSTLVKNFLLISNMEESQRHSFFTAPKSPEAYRYLIYGDKAFHKSDYESAIKFYLRAIEIDSNFVNPVISIAVAYGNQNLYQQAKQWCLKAYEKSANISIPEKLFVNSFYAHYCQTPYEAIKWLNELMEIDDNPGLVYYNLSVYYLRTDQYFEMINVLEKALEIYKRWGIKPDRVDVYENLGIAYHRTGQLDKEKKLYKKAEIDFPEDPIILIRKAILSLSERDTIMSDKIINELKVVCKAKAWTDTRIANNIAYIYSQSDYLDKAQEYYQLAISLDKENPDRLNSLAYFLIDNNRDIDEGLKLVDTALRLKPDNYNYLHTRGWGLFRQGKYKESLEILQKSWHLRMKNAIYDHRAFLHLEEAEKAVASQKTN